MIKIEMGCQLEGKSASIRMPYLFITTTKMISQYATLENFENFIGPLYTVLMAFSIYLFITCDPNPQGKEEQEAGDEGGGRIARKAKDDLAPPARDEQWLARLDRDAPEG